ncbi:hypothetical protein CYMTET_55024 [Cymbomonas tetramitiformis]|uniref:60S ribosomal export protein NMD3 n=1 Tax=Cymbomonas tetramitiformis TaxID=36881 RepID=A0AAE0ENS2_9CHLO|nr:hypothetical protein CYMTET_55024 [Cymbomonas tetramitiformis]
MCEQCSKVAANADQWTAVAQVRQHVEHKRTFLYLEQLILKHGAEAGTLGIKEVPLSAASHLLQGLAVADLRSADISRGDARRRREVAFLFLSAPSRRSGVAAGFCSRVRQRSLLALSMSSCLCKEWWQTAKNNAVQGTCEG